MLSIEHRQQLKQLAKSSIENGLKQGRSINVDTNDLTEDLTVQRATFVTLHKQGKLRGCIGTLEAHRPLAVDIAENSFAAAFSDPRFPPLQQQELDQISIHLSILSPASEIICRSEAELINQLRPNIDGLILEDGRHRATFLPSVWESLSDPIDFVRQLKLKAGWAADHWSEVIRAYRYTTESF